MFDLEKEFPNFLPKKRKEAGKDTKERKCIAIYGKGGIGKSTTSANISASAALLGEKVMQVGCDPKRDSIALLCHGMKPTLMHSMIDSGVTAITEDLLKSCVHDGFADVLCVESGGPKPGMGCAGRGVNLSLTTLDRFKLFDEYDVSFLLLDVLGDTVCGGFAQPLRSGFAREVYIVTCGEILTLFQMNNLAKAVNNVREMGQDVGVAGLINNQRGIPNEEQIVEAVAEKMGVPVVAHIPRSQLIQKGELKGQCLLEAFPDSDMADIYKSMTKKILNNEDIFVPKPIKLKEIKEIVRHFTSEAAVVGEGEVMHRQV